MAETHHVPVPGTCVWQQSEECLLGIVQTLPLSWCLDLDASVDTSGLCAVSQDVCWLPLGQPSGGLLGAAPARFGVTG